MLTDPESRSPRAFASHDLRHTCAALLIAEGAHPRAIMERLGHSSITVTLNTYGHLFPAIDEALSDRLDAVFESAKPPSVVARGWHADKAADPQDGAGEPSTRGFKEWALRDSNPRLLPCKGSALAN